MLRMQLAIALFFAALPAAAQTPTGPARPGPPEALMHTTVLHVPPGDAPGGVEMRLTAVVDAAWNEVALLLRYRRLGSAGAFTQRHFERSSAGGYFATVPADSVERPGIEYYIVGELPDGTERLHFASRERPHRVIVATSRQVRWAEKERRRLGGYTSSINSDVWGHNFGNRHGNNDRYLRGEIDWTHHLLGQLYSISVGYGFIAGETPDRAGSMAESDKQGARYGYGQVRLMLSRSIWLDGRAVLGVSREGFITGGGGTLTVGKPWRANVSIGGEYIQELGPSLWIRLQWDTVPPFIMGASIVQSDLPAATLPDGSFIAYDISYPLLGRITLRGSLSFGSRDGPGHFGGGLGASLAF